MLPIREAPKGARIVDAEQVYAAAALGRAGRAWGTSKLGFTGMDGWTARQLRAAMRMPVTAPPLERRRRVRQRNGRTLVPGAR